MTKMTDDALVLATRGSALALWQANFIAEQLKSLGQPVALNVIKTTGDQVQDRFLHEIGGKGLFIKELEEALKAGHADLAMHSLKDMPVQLPKGFRLPAILKRHAVTDVIVFKSSLYQKLSLKQGAVLGAKELKALGPMKIATSSLRRQALLEQLGSGIKIQPVRGNVDTRLRKLEEQEWHALILAEASLDRLGINKDCVHRLDPAWFVPCAGQGAIAIETTDKSTHLQTLAKLDCADTRRQIMIERDVLHALGGDCTMPFGCLVQPDARHPGHWHGRVIVLDMQGGSAVASYSMPLDLVGDGRVFVTKLLEELKKNGVNDILRRLGISREI